MNALPAGRQVTGHLFGHTQANSCSVTEMQLASSPSALPGTLASSCSDLLVKCWDVRTRRPTHTLQVRKTPSWPRCWANFSLF